MELTLLWNYQTSPRLMIMSTYQIFSALKTNSTIIKMFLCSVMIIMDTLYRKEGATTEDLAWKASATEFSTSRCLNRFIINKTKICWARPQLLIKIMNNKARLTCLTLRVESLSKGTRETLSPLLACLRRLESTGQTKLKWSKINLKWLTSINWWITNIWIEETNNNIVN